MSKGISLAILTLFAVLLIFESAYSQDHDEEDQHHHKNEITFAAGIVLLVSEDKITEGIHLHYIRGIGENNRFGLGVGFETILDEHKHYTISLVIHYRVYEGFIIAYAPGAIILTRSNFYKYQFAHHIELAYEFELGVLHIGPVAELGIERNGIHYMGGIHLGIDF